MPNKKTIIGIIVAAVIIIVFLVMFFSWRGNGGTTLGGKPAGEYHILYQKGRHEISLTKRSSGTDCYSLNLKEYLDAGLIKADGTENKVLDLKDYPMSIVTSQKNNNYYYCSAAIDPVTSFAGFSYMNWDLPEQTLYAAGFSSNQASTIKSAENDKFPGGDLASPDNQYLVYLMTQKAAETPVPTVGFVSSRLNAYATDSDLIIRNLKNGREKIALAGNYNRQLFGSLADFSADGKYFYTIARHGDSFQFVRVTLDSGTVTNFSEALPGFDWSKINWEDFFKKNGDLAWASFRLAPNAERMIAYKNKSAAVTDVDACFTTATHNLWLFDISHNTLETREEKDYAIHAAWKGDSQEFALALTSAAGCYPGYLDARIDKMDKDGKNLETLVTEKQSKITRIGWAPSGDEIAYDVYGTDLVGRIKIVNSRDESTREVVNSQTLEGSVDKENPVLLHFSNWVTE